MSQILSFSIVRETETPTQKVLFLEKTLSNSSLVPPVLEPTELCCSTSTSSTPATSLSFPQRHQTTSTSTSTIHVTAMTTDDVPSPTIRSCLKKPLDNENTTTTTTQQQQHDSRDFPQLHDTSKTVRFSEQATIINVRVRSYVQRRLAKEGTMVATATAATTPTITATATAARVQ